MLLLLLLLLLLKGGWLDRAAAAAAAEGPSLCFAFFIYLFKLVAVRSKFDRRERDSTMVAVVARTLADADVL